jgi:hypothetical protein
MTTLGFPNCLSPKDNPATHFRSRRCSANRSRRGDSVWFIGFVPQTLAQPHRNWKFVSQNTPFLRLIEDYGDDGDDLCFAFAEYSAIAGYAARQPWQNAFLTLPGSLVRHLLIRHWALWPPMLKIEIVPDGQTTVVLLIGRLAPSAWTT